MKQNIYSQTKIFGHLDKIQAFRDGRITAPIYVRIKPTNRCSHSCTFCSYSDGTTRPKDRPELHLQTHMHTQMREQDVMPKDKAIELIDDLAAIGVKAVTFSGGGEPLNHPNIAEIMNRVLLRDIHLSIITNGQALTPKNAFPLIHAKWVRVSIDYADAAQMAQSRNVPLKFFDQVRSNIADFAKAKDHDCDLGINFIVTRANHLRLTEAAVWLADIGVENIRFSPVYIDGFREYHEPIKAIVEEQLQRIPAMIGAKCSVNSFYDIDSPSKSKVRPFHRCLYQETVPVVGADLGVYRCHNVSFSEHGLIGSIKDRKFSDLWFSEEAKRNMQGFNPSAHCNHECSNHEKVRLFNELAESASDSFV